MKRITTLLLCCLFLTVLIVPTSCGKTDGKTIPVFDLGQATVNSRNFDIMEIAGKIEILPMKVTTDKSLLGNITRFHLYGDTVVFVSNMPLQLSAFNLSSGEFLYTVGRQGRGPNEWQSAYRAVFMDDEIWVDGATAFKVYDTRGNYLHDLDLKLDAAANSQSNAIPERKPLGGDKLAAYHFNVDGREERLITIFDKQGNAQKTYPNNRLFDRRRIEAGDFSFFYEYGEDLFWSEQPRDTVYRITLTEMTPHLVLRRSPVQRISYEGSDWGEPSKLFLYNVHEYDEYLFVGGMSGENDWYYICNKSTGEVVGTTPEKMDAFTTAALTNAVSDSRSTELYTFLFPHEWMDARDDGSLPAELAGLDIDEKDNPIVLKITLKST